MNGPVRSSTSVAPLAGPLAPRGPRSAHWVDRGLAIGCAVVVAVSMLVWTGVVPSRLYPSDRIQWTLAVPTCATPGSVPSVEYAFPLWATVHVRWTSGEYPVEYIIDNFGFGRASEPLLQLGVGGSGSFVSDATPYLFWVTIPFVNETGCPEVPVTTTVTYTL